MAERLALPTSVHGVAGSNPAGGKILPEPKRRFIVQSLSCSPFHRLEMTEILLKGRKTWKQYIFYTRYNVFVFFNYLGYLPAKFMNIKSEMRSFKSNENIPKKEGGSYYVVSANKASSVTL